MKKLLVVLSFLFMLLPGVNAKEEKEPVKVYIFQAGGCPYCEAEIEYLKGLESYEKKFVIVEKELYVDHVDWKEGADFNLGVNVANAFVETGLEEFADASYAGTPFVVISDLYAKSAYNTSLESIINQAYDEGDKDIVSCIGEGNTDCLKHLIPKEPILSTADSIILISVLLFAVLYILKSTMDTNKILDAIEESNQVKNSHIEEKIEVKKEPVKNTNSNKNSKNKSKKK